MANIEDGILRAAVRIICFNEAPAPENIETLMALIDNDKHPVAPADFSCTGDTIASDAVPINVPESVVLSAVMSFSPGSLDSLTPQHFKDMMGVEGNPKLLTNLTKLVNILLEGRVPEPVAILYGGNLIALQKKLGVSDLSRLVMFCEGWSPNALTFMQLTQFQIFFVTLTSRCWCKGWS